MMAANCRASSTRFRAIGLNSDLYYEHVIEDAIELDVFGLKVQCMSLDRLIAVKKELNRPRDRLAVMELEALKRLKSPRG